MKNIIFLLTLIILLGCGVDTTDEGYYPPMIRNTEGVDSITVSRTSCKRTYWQTTFKYIVIAYPNNDADVYCAVNENVKIKSYLSNNPYVETATCKIDIDIVNSWQFYLFGSGARLSLFGGEIQVDIDTGNALPFAAPFINCRTETWDDEHWYESYYSFNERLL